MKKTIYACPMLIIALLPAGSGLAQTKLYDGFTSPTLNPAKWYGAGGDGWMFETQRVLVPVTGSAKKYQLHLMQRAYAPTTNDNGGAGGVFGLGFPSPNAITAASFSVVVNAITKTVCTNNPSNTGVTSTDFRGSFFNTQTKPTSQMGDVDAAISIDNGGTGLEVVGFYMECMDSSCGSQTILDYKTLGTVQLGATNTIGMEWDKANHQFIFSLNGVQTLSPYTVTAASNPFSSGKTIDIARVTPDCSSTPRPYTSIDVDIGPVYVNTK